MPVYEYKGIEYDINTTDATEAKAKILKHLGTATSKEEVPTQGPTVSQDLPPAEAVTEEDLLGKTSYAYGTNYRNYNKLANKMPFEERPTSVTEMVQMTERNIDLLTKQIANPNEPNYKYALPQWQAELEKETKNLNLLRSKLASEPTETKETPQPVPTPDQEMPEQFSFIERLGAEAISGGEFFLGMPEWGAGIIYSGVIHPLGSVLGNLAARAKTGDTSLPLIDWEQGKTDAVRIVSPLGNLKKPMQMIAEATGLEEAVPETGINRSLGKISEFLEGAAVGIEKATGIPKAGSMAVIETAMITGIPGIRAAKSKVSKTVESAKETIAPKSEATAANPIVKTEPVKPVEKVVTDLDVPAVEASYKAIDDSLYKIDNLSKLDQTEMVTLDKRLKELNVPEALQEKFRRYDEGFAEGAELIPARLYEKQKLINDIFAENKRIIAEKDPAQFRKLQENKMEIERLREEKLAIEATRTKKEELTRTERELYEMFYEPMKTEIIKISDYLSKQGRIPEFGRVDNFAPRKLKTNPKDKSIWQHYKEAIIGRDFTDVKNDVYNIPNAGKSRDLFVMEDAVNPGKREVVSIKEISKDGTDMVQVFYPGRRRRWEERVKNGERITQDFVYNLPAGTKITSGSELAGLGKIAEATVAELERTTGKQYEKNYAMVLADKLGQLRKQARLHEYEKALLEAKDVAWKPKKITDVPPEGFSKLEFTNEMPLTEGYYFPERIKEVLDDYNRPVQKTAINKINNALVTNMMLVPIAHMHNELFHWGVTRGASGFVNPKRLLELTKTLPAAIKEVQSRGEVYKEILREGGSTMSANIRNSIYLDEMFNNSLNTMVKEPGFKEVAKAVGVAPAKLYRKIALGSNKAMWVVRDIMTTQLIMEKKLHNKGMTTAEAIRSTERHMPNYRLGSRVITQRPIGRQLNKVLGNRAAFLFARYHAGMVGSAKNVVMDMLGKNPELSKSKSFVEGLDSALALGVAMAVVYPLLDDVAGMIADVFDADGKIEKAKFRRAGVAHVFDVIKDIAKSEKDQYALASILVTPSPVLQVAVETAFNKELYNNRNVFNIEDELEPIAIDYMGYLARKVPQASQAMQATNEDYGTGWAGILLRNFFDIKTQTGDQLDRIEEQVNRRKTAAENRKWDDL